MAFFRLFRFNRKSGMAFRRAVARAWHGAWRDPFKPTKKRSR